MPATPLQVLVATKKGAFTLTSDSNRQNWHQSDPIFLGHIVHHVVSDPRNQSVCLMAAKTGHLGPTVFRSLDGGKSWKEASAPPAFAPPVSGDPGDQRSVDRVFWLTPGHASEKDTWYAGTSPAGIFKSADAGDTWTPVSGFNEHPMYKEWTGVGPTPDGQFLHSIRVHPHNAKQMYLAISIGGVFESTDAGENWAPLNQGCYAEFLPDDTAEFGHDPHCLIVHPTKPERLYQQNHCGSYRMDRPNDKWIRIGDNMPREVGDIGFPIVVHPSDPDTAWVFPMDGTDVWPRTSPDGKPSVYVTRDGGASWHRQDKGLPPEKAYFTVKRQAMTTDRSDPVGLYFGTTTGEVWASADGGESWSCIARHMPEIYALDIREG